MQHVSVSHYFLYICIAYLHWYPFLLLTLLGEGGEPSTLPVSPYAYTTSGLMQGPGGGIQYRKQRGHIMSLKACAGTLERHLEFQVKK